MKCQDVLLDGTKKRRLANKELEAEKKKIIERWMGKPKGMLQVLWERGFIDEGNLQQYTIDGKKDAYGVLIPTEV
jgi:hypothetical protein